MHLKQCAIKMNQRQHRKLELEVNKTLFLIKYCALKCGIKSPDILLKNKRDCDID